MPHILIADDERYQRLLMCEILSSDRSLTFEEATNGQHALDLARLQRPDLVLLDMMMPILDGLETCRRFKSDPVLQTVLVLLVTAGRQVPPNSPTWQATGANGLIHKPFEEGALQAAVDVLLRPGRD